VPPSGHGLDKVMAELALAKAKLQDKIEVENRLIQDTIRTHRSMARMALKRKKSLLPSLEMIKERIHLLEDKNVTKTTRGTWNWLENFEISSWTFPLAVFALGLSVIIGSLVMAHRQE